MCTRIGYLCTFCEICITWLFSWLQNVMLLFYFFLKGVWFIFACFLFRFVIPTPNKQKQNIDFALSRIQNQYFCQSQQIDP